MFPENFHAGHSHVGIEMLDKQHKQIVGIINRFIEEPEEGFDPDEAAVPQPMPGVHSRPLLASLF